ncbi:MAG: glycosyltransferase [Ignavibacteriae bacterium]|nr:glycosyltransferase [Ignavibacteriota bacterium]
MNICLATYQSAVLLKGGPRTQIFQTKRCLEELGVNVTLFESWQEFRADKVDLIHLFGANIGTYHLAREIHKLGVPMAVTPIFFSRHAVPFLRVVTGIDGLVRRFVRGTWIDYGLVADICSWARVVLPNTKREAYLLEKGLGVDKDKITVIPNGVEERFYYGDPALFKQQYEVDNFVLNVGHIGPGRKNVLRLIRALEKINVSAVIIGRIEHNEYGRRCCEEAKKNPRVLILDTIPNESDLLPSAYAACDVFVLPSLFETPGIAALEAALAGAKIVISKHGGTEEYFGSHAEYVEPTSVELIHHGIVTALNKKRDGTLRERMRKEFLWERVAAQTRDVYENVLTSR